MALEALNRIATLYAMEAEAAAFGFHEHQALWAALHNWLTETRAKTAPGGCRRQRIGLQPPSLAGLQPLCVNQAPPHRQQPHRKLHTPDCHWQEKLPVCGFGTGWCPCRSHPNISGYSQA